VSQDSSKDVSQDAEQDPSEDSSKDVSQDAEQDPLEDSSKDVSQDAEQDPLEDALQDASQGLRLEIVLIINNKTKGTAGSKKRSCLFGKNK
jgi:hypothetical protein